MSKEGVKDERPRLGCLEILSN